ncbi:MAG: hypothetical protein ABEL51_14175 [Salinibacter sp.]
MPALDCTLGEGLRRWLAQTTSDEIADHFFPWIRSALVDTGYNLDRPATEEALQSTQALLRRADITPARMRRAVREARRAEAEGLSVLEWAQGLQARAYSKDVAEDATQRAKDHLTQMTEGPPPDLDVPPTPKDTFAFLLAWEELGGTPALAALRELLTRARGAPPQN